MEPAAREMSYGSGNACWRRLVAWQEAGVWQRIQEPLLAEILRCDQLDPTRAIVDSSSVRGMAEGKKPDRTRATQVRRQTPPHHRRSRHPTRGHPDRCEPPRHHPELCAGRRDSACSRQVRPCLAQTTYHSERAGLQFRATPSTLARTRYHALARQSQLLSWQRTGQNVVRRKIPDWVVSYL
jgi:hypothetical protein